MASFEIPAAGPGQCNEIPVKLREIDGDLSNNGVIDKYLFSIAQIRHERGVGVCLKFLKCREN